MAFLLTTTLFPPTTTFSPSSSSSSSPSPSSASLQTLGRVWFVPPKPRLLPSNAINGSDNGSLDNRLLTTFGSQMSATLAAALLLSSACPALAFDDAAAAYQTYFGTAASASSYGGYGGNVSKRDTAEYRYEVPQGWKERLISKIEKGTNGTDSEFHNPRRKEEKVYLTFLPGFRKLSSRDTVLNDLALSDVNLQDILASADNIRVSDRIDSGGQLYYDFEVDSASGHGLISVTCAKNKLYAHFVMAPVQDWARDESMLRHVHESFATVGAVPLETV
eukprot:c17822_g1_i1 orf=324-1154(-)